jgi:hypothetical protein
MISDLYYLKGYYYGLMNANIPASNRFLRPQTWLQGIEDARGDYRLMNVEQYKWRMKKALRELEAAKLEQ